MSVPAGPPCEFGLVRPVFRDGCGEVFVVDCVLVSGHSGPHVTAVGQRFSEGAAI